MVQQHIQYPNKMMNEKRCLKIENHYNVTWEIKATLWKNEIASERVIRINMNQDWEDVYEAIVKYEPYSVEIPVREEMFPKTISSDYGHVFNKCIGRIQSAVRKIVLLVDNLDDQEKIGHLIQNYTLYQRNA